MESPKIPVDPPLPYDMDMEPADKRTVYVIYSRPIVVEYRNGLAGPPEGWWVQFDGSMESIYFGDGFRPFLAGELVKITFEKVIQDAK